MSEKNKFESAHQEWLETDGRGGYAMGTTTLECTRKYHGYLVHARQAPVDRVMLVNRMDLCLIQGNEHFTVEQVESFTVAPSPTWTLRFSNGVLVQQQFILCRESMMSVLQWTVLEGEVEGELEVRPQLTGRDHHAQHYNNTVFDFTPVIEKNQVSWLPYSSLPTLYTVHTGEYYHSPLWTNGVHYEEEENRGYASHEDLASPGYFRMNVQQSMQLALIADRTTAPTEMPALATLTDAVQAELTRRQQVGTALDRAAEDFIVSRGDGKSIIAGYPWFNDWGRDTMIALRGLGIARGEQTLCKDVLLTWAATLSQGMLPNCFVDQGQTKYNSVDAALWFAINCYEYLNAPNEAFPAKLPGRDELVKAVLTILEYFGQIGTRYGIIMDKDGLLKAGDMHTQLTWMDANVDGEPVTPRAGKSVEIQALWLNALWIGQQLDSKWAEPFKRGLASFNKVFPLKKGYLADVVDIPEGGIDTALRPNQLLAIGGLPCVLVSKEFARAMIDTIEKELWTPLGMRTLSKDSPDYSPVYFGDVHQRDEAYHQGTAWPWLSGPFIEAWLRVRDFSDEAIAEATTRFINPLMDHLSKAGINHIAEIADSEAPHIPRGCPFQAWSLSELIRIRHLIETPEKQTAVWAKKDIEQSTYA